MEMFVVLGSGRRANGGQRNGADGNSLNPQTSTGTTIHVSPMACSTITWVPAVR
jgi:hypothetical protein